MGKKKEKGIEMSDIAGKRGKKGKVGAAADPPPDYETYVDMSSTAKLTDKGGYVVPEGYGKYCQYVNSVTYIYRSDHINKSSKLSIQT